MSFFLRVLAGLGTLLLLATAVYLFVLFLLVCWRWALVMIMQVWAGVEEANKDFREFLHQRFSSKKDK